MAQIPDILPAPPIIARPGLIPGRIIPLLMPRLGTYATKVTMKTQEYPLSATEKVPASDLVPKLVTGFTDEYGTYHEIYLYLRNNVDPEAVLDIRIGGKNVAEGEIVGEVSRMCAAQLDVYVNGALIKSFPKDVEAGYVGFTIPS